MKENKNKKLNSGELNDNDLNQVAGGMVNPRIDDDILDSYEDNKPSGQGLLDRLLNKGKKSPTPRHGGSVYY